MAPFSRDARCSSLRWITGLGPDHYNGEFNAFRAADADANSAMDRKFILA
jgi:hypothetical protein